MGAFELCVPIGEAGAMVPMRQLVLLRQLLILAVPLQVCSLTRVDGGVVCGAAHRSVCKATRHRLPGGRQLDHR